MVKQQQHKTVRRRTPIGSKYNDAVVPKMEDKHKHTKNGSFYLKTKTKKAPKLKSK